MSAWHFCCWMHTDGQKAGEREEPQALHRELRFSAKNPAGVGLIWGDGCGAGERKRKGKGNEKEKPFLAAPSEMQGGCQCVLMPSGEAWM